MTFYVSRWGSYEHPTHTGMTIWEAVAITNSGYDRASGWSCIDLRPDPDKEPSVGFALVWTAFALPSLPAGTWLLAAGPDDTLPTAVRNRINTLTGVTVPASTTLRQLVRQLLTVEAKGPTSARWRPVLPSAGKFRVALGDLDDLWASG